MPRKPQLPPKKRVALPPKKTARPAHKLRVDVPGPRSLASRGGSSSGGAQPRVMPKQHRGGR